MAKTKQREREVDKLMADIQRYIGWFETNRGAKPPSVLLTKAQMMLLRKHGCLSNDDTFNGVPVKHD